MTRTTICQVCAVTFEATHGNQRRCPDHRTRKPYVPRPKRRRGDCELCFERAQVAPIGSTHVCLRCLAEVHIRMLAEQKLYPRIQE